MAAHIRKQIRDAAAAALGSATTGGANTFESRTHELQDANLPARRVYTNDEDARISSLGTGRLIERALELVVECCSKKASGLDDELDLMIQETEVIIAANQSIGGAKYVQLARIDIDMEGEAEKEVGVARMTFNVLYITALATPDTAL